MANRLASESSPYLRQHAGNPVDWYPWGPEALARARAEQKPIFLSVGYSTCHWCHVMEHESFEHAEIAAMLNAHFISIKVDREERPDIDRVYMLFVQATTGQGGWPMSVFLTPDLQPFYGGTYFPPTARFGRPGFLEVLQEISRTWREERSRVTASAATLTDRLREATRPEPQADGGVHVAPPAALDAALALYVQAYDARFGGFGTAPKFPRPSELLFLLRQHALSGNPEGLEMSLETLRGMATGGMRDHVGGGFHRYSVDAFWRVPHFEKMLYDQAQLVLALLEASQASGDPFYASVAEDTLAYVARELTGPEGGFLSAEDADSVPADEADAPHPRRLEGAFYLWSLEDDHRRRRAGAGAARHRALRACCRAAMPRIRRASSAAATCCTSRATSRTWRRVSARPDRRDHPRPADRAAAAVRPSRRAAAPAARRQGAHGVERADDRRIRTCGAAAAQPESTGRDVAARGRAGRAVPPRHAVGCQPRRPAAPLARPATRPSTRTPRITRTWPGDCSSCSRPPARRRGWNGRAISRRSSTTGSGTTSRADGSRRPVTTRACCCG